MVVYRATPAGVSRACASATPRIPDIRCRRRRRAADPALHAAFFALLYDQDLNTPISVFAQDDAGNRRTRAARAKVFARTFRRSRIEMSTAFLQRVVPAILREHA